jgi:Tfp pilus assembly protein PilV
MSVRSRLGQQGGTLLEALVALALMAVSALGVVSTQWWIARAENDSAMRERAAFIADSIVEAMRGSASEPAALSQWATYAADTLPNAEVSVRETGNALPSSIVRWTSARQDPSASSGQGACHAAAGIAEPSCAAIAFVR